MAEKIFYFTIYETFLSVIFGLLSIFLGTIFIKRFLMKTTLVEIVNRKNIAEGIFFGAVLFCLLLLTRTSITPSVNYLQTLAIDTATLSFSFYSKAFLYFLLFYLFAFVVTFIILFLAVQGFMLATTDIDEFKEIKEGRSSIAIILAFTLIGFTFYVRPSLEHLLSGFVGIIS